MFNADKKTVEFEYYFYEDDNSCYLYKTEVYVEDYIKYCRDNGDERTDEELKDEFYYDDNEDFIDYLYDAYYDDAYEECTDRHSIRRNVYRRR